MVDGDRVVPVDVGSHVKAVALAEGGPGEGAEKGLIGSPDHRRTWVENLGDGPVSF